MVLDTSAVTSWAAGAVGCVGAGRLAGRAVTPEVLGRASQSRADTDPVSPNPTPGPCPVHTPPGQHAHQGQAPQPTGPHLVNACLPSTHPPPGAQAPPHLLRPTGSMPLCCTCIPRGPAPQPSPGPAPSTPLAQHVHPRAQPPAPQGTGRAHVWRRGLALWARRKRQPASCCVPLFFHLFLNSFIEVRLAHHRAHPCQAGSSVGFSYFHG